MELEYALLADAAQVSDGKTFILGGGVTILWRQQFPASLGVVLVAQLTYHRSEADSDHALRIQVIDMPEHFPEFDSDDEMRDWFDTADLSSYRLDEALEIVVASHVQLSVGEEPASSGTTTRGAIGTLREPIRLVRG